MARNGEQDNRPHDRPGVDRAGERGAMEGKTGAEGGAGHEWGAGYGGGYGRSADYGEDGGRGEWDGQDAGAPAHPRDAAGGDEDESDVPERADGSDARRND